MTDEVIPRYLVMVAGNPRPVEFESEERAIWGAEIICRHFADTGRILDHIEVVKSVRRWEMDAASGEMLEVGEKLR